jgi:hypothetical protein
MERHELMEIAYHNDEVSAFLFFFPDT